MFISAEEKKANIDDFFDTVFQDWVKEINIDKKSVSYTYFIRKNPSFRNYDDWKTASNDDYYDEYEDFAKVDIDNLYEYLHEAFLSECDELYLATVSPEEIIEDMRDFFHSNYKFWEEEFKEELIEQEEKDY